MTDNISIAIAEIKKAASGRGGLLNAITEERDQCDGVEALALHFLKVGLESCADARERGVDVFAMWCKMSNASVSACYRSDAEWAEMRTRGIMRAITENS